MKTLKTIWIYASVISSLLLIYLFYNIDTTDRIRTKPVHIHKVKYYSIEIKINLIKK